MESNPPFLMLRHLFIHSKTFLLHFCLQVTYSLSSSSPTTLPFYIDSATGTLIVNGTLDHEAIQNKEKEYQFVVVASDNAVGETK